MIMFGMCLVYCYRFQIADCRLQRLNNYITMDKIEKIEDLRVWQEAHKLTILT